MICYGVDGATNVRIDPAIEQLVPALSRCFNVTPTSTTKYTLTAGGANGTKAAQEITIAVGGAAPEIYDFSANSLSLKRGQQASICFKARNAVSVTGHPGTFYLKGKPAGDCIMDKPQKTTRYVITVKGATGETDSREATVKVE